MVDKIDGEKTLFISISLILLMHDLFKKRRSVREFTNEEVTDEQIKQILTAAMIAPSGKNIRPYEFMVIRDKKRVYFVICNWCKERIYI